MNTIAIFASGKGSNADAICSYFTNHATIKVGCIFSDRKAAGVFDVALKHTIPSVYITKELLQSPQQFLSMLNSYNITFIVLAGYLKLMPVEIIAVYKNRIINIHPALLPKYGGKGMFGMHVHEAVYNAQDKETGITIHQVNEEYDKGAIIFQAKVVLEKTDTPKNITEKIHLLEMLHFPREIEKVVLESNIKV